MRSVPGAHGHELRRARTEPSCWCVTPAGSAERRVWSGTREYGKSEFPSAEPSECCCPASLSVVNKPAGAGRRGRDGTGQNRAERGAAPTAALAKARGGAACHSRSRPAPGLGGTGRGWAPWDFVTGPGEGSAGPLRPGTCGEERPPTLPRGRRSPPPAGGRTNSPRCIVRSRTTSGRSRPAGGGAARRRGSGRAGTVTPVPRGGRPGQRHSGRRWGQAAFGPRGSAAEFHSLRGRWRGSSRRPWSVRPPARPWAL